MDAYKFITTKRRPLAQRAQDIGAWFGILQSLTYISVATNVSLAQKNIPETQIYHFETFLFQGITIALASDFVPHMVYKYGYSDDSSLVGYLKFSLSGNR